MSKFTVDNSEFTLEQCNALNRAIEILAEKLGLSADDKSISDRLNNAWCESIALDVNKLVQAA